MKRRLGLYFAAPVIATVTPLVLLPSVASQFGEEGWSTLAVAQATGTMAAVIVELGWSLTGPQLLSTLGASATRSLVRQSFGTRLIVLLVLTPIVAGTSAYISPGHNVDAALIAVGSATFGLASGWVFAGKDQPLQALIVDTAPRATCTLLAAFLVIAGSPLFVIGLLWSAASLMTVCSTLLFVSRESSGTQRLNFPQFSVKRQLPIVRFRMVSSVYQSFPVALLSIIDSQAVGGFAAADRFVRLANTGLTPLANSQQAAMGRSEAATVRALTPRLFTQHLSLGAAAAAIIVIGGTALADLLLNGTVDLGFALLLFGGGTVLATSANRVTGPLILVRLGQIDVIERSVYVGTTVFLLLFAPLSLHFGASGMMAAVFLAEIAVFLVQARGVWKGLS